MSREPQNRKSAVTARQRPRLAAILVVSVVIAGAGVVGWRVGAPPPDDAALHEVIVSELSPAAVAGKAAFDTNCAQCHGRNAAGTDKGPPLVHDIYNPGHHEDTAFLVAARQGVPQHHWSFGNKPAQPNVMDREVTAIVRYIRELQIANGITYRPHRM